METLIATPVEQDVKTIFNPIATSERIESLDIMRGFVLCGILLMNITGFGLDNAYSDPTHFGWLNGLEFVRLDYDKPVF